MGMGEATVLYVICHYVMSYRSNNLSTSGAPHPCPLPAFTSASARSAQTCRPIELDFNAALAFLEDHLTLIAFFASAMTH